MNYRFKQAIKEELARLETMHIESIDRGVSTVASRDYVSVLKHRTMKKQTASQLPLHWAFRLFSFR